MVQGLDPHLQEQMCPALGPLHGLALHKAFAEYAVDCRLHKGRRNHLPTSIPPPIVGKEAAIVLDIGTELLHGALELGKPKVAVGKVVNVLVEVLESVQVDNARAKGWTWKAIAERLGVSKQAVHQKYGGGRLFRAGR